MKNCYYYTIFFLVLVHIQNLSAQYGEYKAKPPWIGGNMPYNVKGTFKVINVESYSLDTARKHAKEEIITHLLAKAGVTVSTGAVLISDYELRGTSQSTGSIKYREETHIESGKVKLVFAEVDRYYKKVGGKYKLWVLYVIPETKKSISHLPVMAYKLDNGAWRSIIVPGWGQFYQKRYGAGVAFLGGEVALLSSGFYFRSKYSSNNTKSKEAASVSMKQEYRNRANKYKTYSIITFGAAAGWYIYNLVDAFTSSKGKLEYNYGKMNLAFYPSVAPTFDNNMCMMASVNIKF